MPPTASLVLHYVKRLAPFVALALLFVLAISSRGSSRQYAMPVRQYFQIETFSGAIDVDVAFNGDLIGAAHPLENACKFPIPSPIEPDIASEHYTPHIRDMQCPTVDNDMASMDSEGYMYVHPYYSKYSVNSSITFKTAQCWVAMFEAHFRPNANNVTVKTIMEVKLGKRFYVNADNFEVRCVQEKNKKDSPTVFQKLFAGLRDLTREQYTIDYVSDSLSEFNRVNYENHVKKQTEKASPEVRRLSIDILGMDSTSRTQFARHMPRSSDLMKKLGFVTLYGYNKVGDNSAVNLIPVLAGGLPKGMNDQPRISSTGDINDEWHLPCKKAIDPSKIDFLWKIMKEQFNCTTMFNDDIMHSTRGLFHYSSAFQKGFSSQPTDHYFRPYYVKLYKSWKDSFKVCWDGDVVQREFLDIWRRFASRYRDVCHFGFTFISSLTHDFAWGVELLDEKLASSLENLHTSGALDNTAVVIMGDHGNRIGIIQWSYSGRIEERMPQMSIYLPKWWREANPKEYANLIDNQYRITHNYDVHLTLRDIATMNFGKDRKPSRSLGPGRGISLFEEIPKNRTCSDMDISENMCTCMVDRAGVQEPLKGFKQQTNEKRHEKLLVSLNSWLSDRGLYTCINKLTLEVDKQPSAVLGPNDLVRGGFRTMTNATRVQQARAEPVKHMEILHLEYKAKAQTLTGASVDMLIRFKEHERTADISVYFEPMIVRSDSSKCGQTNLPGFCRCIVE